MQALLGLALWSSSQVVQAVELRGFRGVLWGDDVSRLGPAERVQAGGELSCYRRERENLLFGDSPLAEVRYCFHRGRLFMVLLEANVDLATLRAEFESSYGPPDAGSPTRVLWGSKTSATRVELVPAVGQRASMRIYSSEYEPR